MDRQLVLRREKAVEERVHPIAQACSKLEKLENNARNEGWRLAQWVTKPEFRGWEESV